ncbi:paired domain-containing protein [Trichonephila clavipes]|uniref:Paired domain-containing protein n=1 Tax=Trichonephila clavipes TaxID=2585209 RepID=A0A8X6WKU0_TRICX|nr:paired domain-containing protein [Trichonephila clavipes]
MLRLRRDGLGVVNQSLSSPNLPIYHTSLNYFLCRQLKNLVYATPLDSDEDLVVRISETASRVHKISGILERVHQSLHQRCRACIATGGRSFEQSLYKIYREIILKMAPKTKEISLDMIKHITELRKEGKSFREIGNILKLSFTTAGHIVKKYLESGSVENKPRPGGPRKLTSRAKRMIVRSSTNKPMTSAQNIANELLSVIM